MSQFLVRTCPGCRRALEPQSSQTVRAARARLVRSAKGVAWDLTAAVCFHRECVPEGYDVVEPRPSPANQFTDSHPWLAALALGLAVFSLVFALEVAVLSSNSPATDAALAGALVALPIGIVWRGDIED